MAPPERSIEKESSAAPPVTAMLVTADAARDEETPSTVTTRSAPLAATEMVWAAASPGATSQAEGAGAAAGAAGAVAAVDAAAAVVVAVVAVGAGADVLGAAVGAAGVVGVAVAGDDATA